MTDDQNTAADVAGEEAVVENDQTQQSGEGAEAGQQAEQESQDDKGQVKAQPDASEDAEETERKTRSQRRREARKAREVELHRENAELKAQLAQYSGDISKPDPKDYTDPAEYDADLSAYRLEVRLAERQRAQIEERHQAVEKERLENTRQNFQESIAEARGRYADYDAVVFNPANPITQAVVEVIAMMDASADVAYYLGKNPQIAARVSSLGPTQQAIELGKIEAGLSAPKPRQTTKAPPPPTPTRSRATAQKDPSKMSAAEYRKWREGKS